MKIIYREVVENSIVLLQKNVDSCASIQMKDLLWFCTQMALLAQTSNKPKLLAQIANWHDFLIV